MIAQTSASTRSGLPRPTKPPTVIAAIWSSSARNAAAVPDPPLLVERRHRLGPHHLAAARPHRAERHHRVDLPDQLSRPARRPGSPRPPAGRPRCAWKSATARSAQRLRRERRATLPSAITSARQSCGGPSIATPATTMPHSSAPLAARHRRVDRHHHPVELDRRAAPAPPRASPSVQSAPVDVDHELAVELLPPEPRARRSAPSPPRGSSAPGASGSPPSAPASPPSPAPPAAPRAAGCRAASSSPPPAAARPSRSANCSMSQASSRLLPLAELVAPGGVELRPAQRSRDRSPRRSAPPPRSARPAAAGSPATPAAGPAASRRGCPEAPKTITSRASSSVSPTRATREHRPRVARLAPFDLRADPFRARAGLACPPAAQDDPGRPVSLGRQLMSQRPVLEEPGQGHQGIRTQRLEEAVQLTLRQPRQQVAQRSRRVRRRGRARARPSVGCFACVFQDLPRFREPSATPCGASRTASATPLPSSPPVPAFRSVIRSLRATVRSRYNSSVRSSLSLSAARRLLKLSM